MSMVLLLVRHLWFRWLSRRCATIITGSWSGHFILSLDNMRGLHHQDSGALFCVNIQHNSNQLSHPGRLSGIHLRLSNMRWSTMLADNSFMIAVGGPATGL